MVVDHVVFDAGLLHLVDQISGSVGIPPLIPAGFSGSDAIPQNIAADSASSCWLPALRWLRPGQRPTRRALTAVYEAMRVMEKSS